MRSAIRLQSTVVCRGDTEGVLEQPREMRWWGRSWIVPLAFGAHRASDVRQRELRQLQWACFGGVQGTEVAFDSLSSHLEGL
jgi:hypothetical protein